MTTKFTGRWNSLPDAERQHLLPFQLERKIRHLEQAKQIAISAHRQHMEMLDRWIKNLERELECYK